MSNVGLHCFWRHLYRIYFF